MVRGFRYADDVDVTDNSGVLAVGAAALSVLATATVVVLAHSPDPASADTYVTSVRNAVVRLVDGSEQTPSVGERLPQGAQVRTGQDGGASLSTSGRTVYVGALSTLDVLDGVRQTLGRGQVMVDSRKGPRLALTTLAGTVAAGAGSLARVETAAVLRLGVFEGSAAITATGRHASTAVGALHQVQVPYGYLPGQVTTLALTDDRWETRLAGTLVSADQDLSHLATSLDGTEGATLLNAAPAALRAGLSVPGRGEQALSVALAQAGHAGTPTDNLGFVQAARRDGGSWGVIAALLQARVSAVSALLDGALTPGGSTPVQALPQVTSLPGLLGPSATPNPAGTRPSSPPPVTPTGTPPPKTPPTTPPPTSPTPLVGSLVDTVLGIIKPPAAPAASGTPTVSPTPAPILPLLPSLPLKLGK
jgi:hypothetical protein